MSEGQPVYGAVTVNWPTVEPYFNETGSNCPSILPGARGGVRLWAVVVVGCARVWVGGWASGANRVPWSNETCAAGRVLRVCWLLTGAVYCFFVAQGARSRRSEHRGGQSAVEHDVRR